MCVGLFLLQTLLSERDNMPNATKRQVSHSSNEGTNPPAGPPDSQLPEHKVEIEKHLSLMHGVSVIVGIIIGSGIFLSPVGVITQVKSVGASLTIWAASGIFSILGALCFAELGVMIPKSGGEYVYIKEAFGPLAGFLTLWVEFFMICAVPTAASALTFATYIVKAIPGFKDCDTDPLTLRLIAASAISLITAINCFNVKWASKTQLLFTGSKLTALCAIVIFGLVHIGQGKTDHLEDPFGGSELTGKSIAFGFYAGFWAYGGWNYLNFLIEELRNPFRDLPRAIVISIGIVTSVYLLANLAYAAVLSPTQMASSNAVAISFADLKLGPVSFLMPIFVAASVFGAINGGMLSISRVFYVGAREGQLPPIIAMIQYEKHTPLPSLLAMFVVSIVLVFMGEIWALIALLGLAFSILLTATICSLLWMRYTKPDLPRPIRVPLPIPIFLLIWCILLISLTVYQSPSDSLKCIFFIFLGIPVYWVCLCWENKPAIISHCHSKMTFIFQKIFMVVFTDEPTNK